MEQCLTRAALVSAALLLLAGCIDRDETITINKDKSGTVEVYQRMNAPMDPMAMLRQMMGGGPAQPAEKPKPELWSDEKLKEAQAKMPEGIKIVAAGTKEKDGEVYSYFKIEFKSLATLKTIDMTVLPSLANEAQQGMGDLPIPMPGGGQGGPGAQLSAQNPWENLELIEGAEGFTVKYNPFAAAAGAPGGGAGGQMANNPMAGQMMQGFKFTVNFVLPEAPSETNAQQKDGAKVSWTYNFDGFQKASEDKEFALTATVGKAPAAAAPPVTTPAPDAEEAPEETPPTAPDEWNDQ